MAGTTTYDQLRAALRPWHAILEPAASLPLQCYESDWRLAEPTFIYWLNGSNLHETDRIEQRRQLEALELFARLALVDWKLWRQHIAEIWPEAAKEWKDLFRSRSFTVGIQLQVLSLNRASKCDDLSRLCERIVTQDHMRSPSPEFQHVCTLMDRLLVERSGIDDATTTTTIQLPSIPVRLEQWTSATETLDDADLFFKILQLVMTQKGYHGCDPSGRGNRAVSRVTGGQLCLDHIKTESCEANARALRYLAELQKHGMTVCDLPRLVLESIPSASAFVLDLQALLATDRGAPNGVNKPRVRGAEFMTIAADFISDFIPPVFSAVQASQSLRSVLLETDDEDADTSIWAWRAFALFSRESNRPQSIQQLEIDGDNWRDENIDAMVRVLKAHNPLDVLFASQRGSMGSLGPSSSFILASTFMLSDPNEMGAVGMRLDLDYPQRVHVIARARNSHLVVLLPAWGKAWVHADDAILPPRDHTTEDDTAVTWTVQSIPHINFGYVDNQSLQVILPLLQLVGAGVESIEFATARYGAAMDTWCKRVMEYCPNLRSLTMEGGKLDSVQVFVDSYNSGRCRLQRLSLGGMLLRDMEIDPLLHALCDKDHAIIRNLQELKYAPRVPNIHTRQETIHLALQMLDSNVWLRKLDMSFNGQVLARAKRKRFKKAFEVYNQMDISVRQRPLGMRHKAAFLSVVTRGGGDQGNAIEQLDSSVLSIIFQFAAKCKQRHVTFTFEDKPNTVLHDAQFIQTIQTLLAQRANQQNQT